MAREFPDALRTLADRYRESQAGRTGGSSADFTFDYQKLLKAAQATSAEARIEAEQQLRQAAARSGGRLVLETHPRDEKLILLLRLKREGGEEWLFQQVGESSPTTERQLLADLFARARTEKMPEAWQSAWTRWCDAMTTKAARGEVIGPFHRRDLAANHELVQVLVQVLNWRSTSLVRFASCSMCGDSKRLEILRPRLEQALTQLTEGRVTSLEDLGLSEKPRQVLLHGPLHLDGLDLGALRGPFSLSETDLRAAASLHCPAVRVLTIENETTFLELAKINRDTLLIQTSYPGRAVLALLTRLPADLPVYHFGDTDPAGFDILRDLRERSQRPIQPLHMRFRPRPGSDLLTSTDKQMLNRLTNHPHLADCQHTLRAICESGTKGDFEQESLGAPTLMGWPFYAEEV